MASDNLIAVLIKSKADDVLASKTIDSAVPAAAEAAVEPPTYFCCPVHHVSGFLPNLPCFADSLLSLSVFGKCHAQSFSF